MISAHEVVREILEMLRLQPIFSAIEVKELLLAELDVIKADHGQLHQAFLNLILNAADAIEGTHCQRNGRISICSENISENENSVLKKPAIKLSFIDNGEGICAEYTEKIFDPFFTTKAPGKGTGLGLGIVKRLATHANGAILLTTDSHGTKFTVLLPAKA